jgi:2,4-dienoyl-CoA reductase (NADPH2)
VGRETWNEFRELRPASAPKRIAVIGGGPGGLEAALTAALRGHLVSVFEAQQSFGGQFLYAASIPHRHGLRRLIDWQLNELRLLNVSLHLGMRIDRAADLLESFDAAIVATGARANPLPTALAATGAVRWLDILDQGAPEPKGNGRAVFVDDGSGFWWNYGVAEALVEAGWTLLFVTPSASVGHQIPHESVGPMLARLGRGSTEYRVLTTLEEVTPDGARLLNLASGEELLVPCGLVVVQTGRSAIAGPTAALIAGGVPEVHEIGDCITPRRMSFATLEAQRVGRTI